VALTFALPPALGQAKAKARAEIIEDTLSREFGVPVSAIVTQSYAELEQCVGGAKTDLAWTPAVVCTRLKSARALLTIVRQGRTSYRSALIGRRDAALSVATLTGLRAAWVDPLSAGGYVLAVATLRAHGVEPDRTFASQRFVGSHRAAVEAVLHDSADVAAVSAYEPDDASMRSMLRWYVGPKGDLLRAIVLSEPCPNDAIVFTHKMKAEEAERFLEGLAPRAPRARVRSRILSALEAERLERTTLDEYWRLSSLLWTETRLSLAPPSGPRSGQQA